jgi:hypothetical protein
MVEITLRGSFSEIGEARGHELKHVTRIGFEHWMPGHTTRYSLKDAVEYGKRMADDMDRRWPEIMTEARAIAGGAQIDEDDYMAYMFRCWNALSGDHPATLACFNMTCVDTQGRLLLSGVLEDSPPFSILEAVVPDTGIPFYSVTWAGMPWTVRSMNKAGLAIGQASAFAGTRFADGTHAFPFDLYARGFFAERYAIQHATTVAEAIDMIRSFDCTSVFTIADRTGKAVTLEACGALHSLREPDQDNLMTAGTFESVSLVKALLDEGIAHDLEGGIQLSKRIKGTLQASKGQWTVDRMMDFIKTEQSDGGWCYDMLQAATIACPSTGELWVCGYRPCATGFKRYTVENLD